MNIQTYSGQNYVKKHSLHSLVQIKEYNNYKNCSCNAFIALLCTAVVAHQLGHLELCPARNFNSDITVV
jgi:hypothetical protein